MKTFTDYSIEHQGLDWQSLLSSWKWLLPGTFTIWFMNCFGDLFLVLDDGSIHMLDVGKGSLEPVALDAEDFIRQADESAKRESWFQIRLVDRLCEMGATLQSGECYSYWELPAAGGVYSVDNARVTTIAQHYESLGPIHAAMKR